MVVVQYAFPLLATLDLYERKAEVEGTVKISKQRFTLTLLHEGIPVVPQYPIWVNNLIQDTVHTTDAHFLCMEISNIDSALAWGQGRAAHREGLYSIKSVQMQSHMQMGSG